MQNEYKVYKARVSNVSVPMNEGQVQREIFVIPLESNAGGEFEKPATPPSVLPTSITGSGMISYPAVGQECLVAEFSGNRHILCYTQPEGFSPYGQLPPDRIDEGSVQFTVSGFEDAKLLMTKKGFVGLISNEFAQIYVDGTEKTVFRKGRNAKTEYAGGYRHDLYNNSNESTFSRHVYTTQKDIRGFSDAGKRIEQGNSQPIPPLTPRYTYADKIIFEYGDIDGENIVFHQKTMQSYQPFNIYDKNIVTSHRVGYQTTHNRHNEQEYPEGTILETSYKKNLQNNVGTMLIRNGKLIEGDQAGEVFRRQFYEGLNGGIPYGSPISDPLGEGRGYNYNPGGRTMESFIESFGHMESDAGSIYRKFIHEKTETGEVLARLQEKLGGSDLYSEIIENEENKVITKIGQDDGAFLQEVWRGDSRSFIRNIFSGAVSLSTVIATPEAKFTQRVEDLGFTFIHEENEEKEQIIVKNKNITLQSSDNVKISIEGEKITLKVTDDSILELTKEGLTYNGESLAFGQLVQLLLDNKDKMALSASPGSPSPMFPVLRANMQINKNWTPNSGKSLTTVK